MKSMAGARRKSLGPTLYRVAVAGGLLCAVRNEFVTLWPRDPRREVISACNGVRGSARVAT